MGTNTVTPEHPPEIKVDPSTGAHYGCSDAHPDGVFLKHDGTMGFQKNGTRLEMSREEFSGLITSGQSLLESLAENPL